MANYTVTDGTNVYPIIEFECKYTGVELDKAEFTIAALYPINTSITILADAAAQFIGYIKEIEELEQGGLWKYTAYEKAVELKTQPYLSSTLDIFQKTDTIYNLVNDVLISTPDSTWDIEAGMTEATSVTLNFYMVNRLQAVNKLLREMRGYYVLFNSATKKVKWLSYNGTNVDRTATDLIPGLYISKKVLSSSMLKGITQIVVIGQDSTIRGSYGSSTSSRAYYQVDDIKTNAEADKIAEAIYGDIGVLYATYEVEVSPDQIQYDVRDKVKVDGSVFWIRELYQGIDEIKFIIDSGKVSVIESMGSRIHTIDGNFPVGSDQQCSGGPTNVSGDQAVTTRFTLNIKDATICTAFVPKFTISKWKSTTPAETDWLSDVSQVVTTSTYTTTTFFGSGYSYLPSSSGLTTSALADGFQFALATISGDWLGAPGSIQIQCQYKIGAGSWYDAGTLYDGYLANDSQDQLSIAAIIPGDSTGGTLYVRWRIYPYDGSNTVRVYSKQTFTVQKVTRHKHAMTRDTTEPVAAPTYLQYSFNGGAWTQFATGATPTLTLTTGENTFDFRADTATYKGAISLSATYQVLGRS